VGDVRQTIRRATLTIASLVVLGIPVVLATPQAASAATACTRVGNIQVTDTDDNTVVGYVSKVWNNDGQFVVTTTPSDYLSAQVTDGAQTNIAGLGDDQLIDGEVVGATSAVDQLSDLATGSALYSSLGGVIPTAPGATPHFSGNSLDNAFDIEAPDESAIWTDAPGTPGALLTAQWINTDGSLAPSHLVVEAGELAVTGDPTALAMAFNGLFDPVFDVALNFVPTAPSSGPCASTTTLSPTASAAGGSPVTFTATVTPSPIGDGAPTGPVAFTSDGAPIAGCTSRAPSASPPFTATCTTSSLTVAGSPHSIVATFAGDADDQLSTSSAISQQITTTPTATTLAASPVGSSVFGQSVAFTATVTGGDGGGTVVFKDGAATLSGCGAVALGGSGPYTATCTTSALAVGSHSVVATYSGDPGSLGGASTALPYTVNKASTTTTLTASPSGSSTFGRSVTFTATVAAAAPGAGAPSGTVAFTVDGTPVGSSTLSGSSQATLSTSSLSAGSHVIMAAYSGDGNFLSSSGSLAHSVTCAVTITGAHSGTLTVSTSTCLSPHATATGAILISGAGALDLEGASVTGAISANSGSGVIRICATSIGGALDIKNQRGLVIVGDPGDAACAPNRINGALLQATNTGGVEAIDNTEHGVSASGNSGPGPFPGDPTTITGNHS
jgi:hypothetical protein